MTQPIGRNSKCPCGSGKKYKHCCDGKTDEFSEDESGTIRRSIPISDDLAGMLGEHIDDLADELGDDFSPETPLFAGQHLEHVEHGISEAMKSSGVDPALIYAFEKTGMIVSKDNQNLISEADLAAWEQAVAEYREGNEPSTLQFVAPDDSLCWSCSKPLSPDAKRCQHCEAEVEDAPSPEDAAMLMELFQEMDPNVIETMKQMMGECETGEEFVNLIMVGPCPTCESDNTGDCENDPEIEDPCIGRCFDCSELFCCDCDVLFKTAAEAGAHDCPMWKDDDDADIPY